MSRRSTPFRQADLTRALKAAAAAGVEVGRIEIDPATGKIVMETGKAAEAVLSSGSWDEVLRQ